MLIALAICALWGGNVVAIKVGLDTFPPFWSAFWRMVTGVAVVALWGWSRGVRLVPLPNERTYLVSLGLLFALQIAVTNHGIGYTSPAYAVVLLNSHPVFANLVGHYFVPEDRLSVPRILGIILAFGGICVVFLSAPDPSLGSHPVLGNILITCSGFLLGSRTVYLQRLVRTIDPIRPILWMMICSLPTFLVVALVLEEPFLQPVRTEAVTSIFYQGAVVAGLCFIVWTTLLKTISPGLLSLFAFSTPIVGVLLSAWIFEEGIAPNLAFGILAVGGGTLVATRTWPRRAGGRLGRRERETD